jgi:hypothetical protein
MSDTVRVGLLLGQSIRVLLLRHTECAYYFYSSVTQPSLALFTFLMYL